MDEIQLSEYHSLNWTRITRILTAYVIVVFKVKKLSDINGKEPKDYVQESITLTLEGKRNWNKGKFPEVIDYLKSVINSLLSNDLNSLRSTTNTKINDENEDLINNLYKTTFNSDDELISKELYAEIKKEVKDDPVLGVYIEFLDYGFSDNEMATACDTTIEEIRNAKKRLRRLTNKIKNNE